jgi:broad specificity phosphatase PhoE
VLVHVVTHPEVHVRPEVPVTQWELSATGRARLAHLVAQPWTADLTRVVSSTERKAVETAEALAAHVGLPVRLDPDLGENDRSATGYLPPPEFEATADEFFAHPDVSVRGWETARSAQQRIVAAVRRSVSGAEGDTAVVGHGGVGTLLLCHLLGVPIDRSHDQPGQGSHFAFDPLTGRVEHGWRRLRPRPDAGTS